MRRLATGLFLMALIVASLVMVSTVHLSDAQTSGTNVSGVLAVDTTWTPAGSPYSLTGNVLVNDSVTLTIQPGVTVNIGSYFIQVNGTLSAQGTPDNKIVISIGASTTYYPGIGFTSRSKGWDNQQNSGSILQYTKITSERSYYPTIKLEYASVKIDSNVINCLSVDSGIECWYGGSPIITNNNITGRIVCHCYDGGYTTISNNTFGGSTEFAINVGGDGIVSNNTISGSNQGILCHDLGGTYNFVTLIAGNLILNNTIGIRVCHGSQGDNGNAKFIIQNNTITNNVRGILFDSEHYSHQINFGPTIQNNNLMNNGLYNLVTSFSSDVNVSSNWWGTTDSQAIDNTIYDFKDDFTLGTIIFSPFLSAPSTSAPAYVNSSAGTGGSIVPSGYVRVDYAGSQTFNIAANPNYRIADVKVNGTSVGSISTYTAQNICGTTNIIATFSNATQTPTPSPSPTPAPAIQATNGNSTINIPISGNITDSQISNLLITSDQSAATTTISLTVTGQSGTVGFGNLTIAKSSVPYGNEPIVYVDGQPAQEQGHTQDAANYYVWFSTHFSTHQISIVFSTTNTSPSPTDSHGGTATQGSLLQIIYGVAAATVIVAVILTAIIIITRFRVSRIVKDTI
jgi:hypothetical protein